MQGINVVLQELLALRETAKALAILNKKSVKSDRYGGYLSHLKGRGIDFEETRAYGPGDDIRMMDWRVTARTGKAHTKVFREERERPVFIVGDFSQNMFFGTKVAFKSNIAAKIAATLAWSANMQGDRVGGVFFTENNHIELKPRSRNAGIFPVLNTLCDLSVPATQQGNQSLKDALMRLRRVAKPGSLIFIISDFQKVDHALINHLMMLAKHNEIIAIQLYDELERTPPIPNYYPITNGHDISLMDTRNKAFCKKYIQDADNKQSLIENIFKQCQIPLIEVATHDNWLDKLLMLIRKVS